MKIPCSWIKDCNFQDKYIKYIDILYKEEKKKVYQFIMFRKFGNVFLWQMDVDPFLKVLFLVRFRFFVHDTCWNDKSKGKDIIIFFFLSK